MDAQAGNALECRSMRGRGASRSAIVEAALACTEAAGWETTSMQAVRERAGVSNGTLFHYFPSRQALASAVADAGLVDHQGALLHELRTAERVDDGVRRAVVRHLRWVEDNRQLARLLLVATPPEALRTGQHPGALASNRGFFIEVAAWLGQHGWSGTPALPVLVALWIGPAQEYARGWLAAPRSPLAPVAAVLAEGAWQALRPLLARQDAQ
jgi:AcrR family transcriptional regulator